MKNYYLLFVLVFFFCPKLNSQSAPKPYEISLENKILKNVYFNFEVLDFRQKTDFIGYIYKSNKKIPAPLKNGAVPQFKTLIEKSDLHNIQQKDSFALVIKELFLNERLDMARLNVFFEFYQIKNDQYFKVHEFDHFYSYKEFFVHKFHSQKISQAIEEAIIEFQL